MERDAFVKEGQVQVSPQPRYGLRTEPLRRYPGVYLRHIPGRWAKYLASSAEPKLRPASSERPPR